MADKPDPDEFAQSLAATSLAAGSPTEWFEALYVAADRGEVDVPWDRGGPHPLLVEWLESRSPTAGPAVVVGFGPGHDAELLSSLGWAVTAFEVSPTAVAAVRERYPTSTVDYRVADLLSLPDAWTAGFDLVVEIMTVQALPRDVRTEAIAAVRSLVAPGGTLVVIGGVGSAAAVDGPPWPLDRAEMESFAAADVRLVALDRVPSGLGGGAARWRAELARDPVSRSPSSAS